jgi:hypothetical protein
VNEKSINRLSSCEFYVYLADCAAENSVFFQGLLDLAAGMQDSRMVAAAEVGADLLQGQLGQVAGQIHADLARQESIVLAMARPELPRLDAKVAAHPRGDALDRRAAGIDLGAEMSHRGWQVEGMPADLVQGLELRNGPLELPAASRQVLSKPIKDFARDGELAALGQLFQKAKAAWGLQRFEGNHQTRGEAIHQAGGKAPAAIGEVPWARRRGEDHGKLPGESVVDDLDQTFGSPRRQVLQVFQNQQVTLACFFTEPLRDFVRVGFLQRGISLFQRWHRLAEIGRGQMSYRYVAFVADELVRQGRYQMTFAGAGESMEIKWIGLMEPIGAQRFGHLLYSK